jgi:peptide deformylase
VLALFPARLKNTRMTSTAAVAQTVVLPQFKTDQIIPILPWSKAINQQCLTICNFDSDLRQFAEDLKRAMYFYSGIGLAASQIGVFLRMAIVTDAKQRVFPVINPEIVSRKGKSVMDEGCLSLPGASSSTGKRCPNLARITRAAEIEVLYQDLEGKYVEEKFDGLLAHVYQHEYDHTVGTFIVDQCGAMARKLVMRKFQNYLTYYGHTDSTGKKIAGS